MMEHGPEAARAFLSQCQYLTNHWLLQHGMSIGIGDTVADATTMGAINDTINKVCHLDSRTTSCVPLRLCSGLVAADGMPLPVLLLPTAGTFLLSCCCVIFVVNGA